MNFSREKIIETLEKVLAADNFHKFYFAEMYTGKNRVLLGCSFTFPRLTYVIDGFLQLNVGSGNEIHEGDYMAGETLVMKPYCVTSGRWDKLHETLGLVMNPEYLRIVHAVHDIPKEPLLLPTDYYHLKDSLRMCTSHALNAVCGLHEGTEADALAPDLLRCAFELLLSDVKNSVVPEYGKAYALWNKLVDRIIATFPEELTRKELADHFMITETYVSRLFTKYGGMTYKEYLRKYRLNKAAHLLDDTNMTIGEIAWNCGVSIVVVFYPDIQSRKQNFAGLEKASEKINDFAGRTLKGNEKFDSSGRKIMSGGSRSSAKRNFSS